MPDARASELVARLRRRELRSGTGILLLAPRHLGDESRLAARLSVEARDYTATLLAELPEETPFVNLSADTERDRLTRIAEARGEYDIVLIANFDVALARLDRADRARLWNALLRHFPYRRRALLLAMPERAEMLLPDPDVLQCWQDEGRLVASNHL